MFVASALVLFAGKLLQDLSPGWQRTANWLALGLMLIYLRRFIPWLEAQGAPSALVDTLPWCIDAVALGAGLMLLTWGRSTWGKLQAR